MSRRDTPTFRKRESGDFDWEIVDNRDRVRIRRLDEDVVDVVMEALTCQRGVDFLPDTEYADISFDPFEGCSGESNHTHYPADRSRRYEVKEHPDWDADGCEDGEDCWRLDFFGPVGDMNAYQAQIFGRIPGEYLNKYGHVTIDDPVDYTGFRLFLERDNRNQQGERWDYACEAMPIDASRAVKLLGMCASDAAKELADEVATVRQLPNDQVMCDSDEAGGSAR